MCYLILMFCFKFQNLKTLGYIAKYFSFVSQGEKEKPQASEACIIILSVPKTKRDRQITTDVCVTSKASIYVIGFLNSHAEPEM